MSATALRAERCEAPAHALGLRRDARFARGLRYEADVKVALERWALSRPRVTLELGPWFRFEAPNRAWRFAQPDAIVDPGPGAPLLILEVKLALDAKAWTQLDALYRPVIEAALGRPARVAAITRSFDPAIRARVPVPVALALGDPGAWLDALTDPTLVQPPASLPVLQWRNPGQERFA